MKYEVVPIDETFPEYVREHEVQLREAGLIKSGVVTLQPVVAPSAPILSGVPNLSKKHWTVTACVSTKDRYATTLPLCISAIATQTRKPDKLVIYDDGEQVDLHTISPFEGLLKMCGELKIPYEIFRTPRKGQVVNHQHALDTCEHDLLWRIDDDCIAMPDCLERLLNTFRDHGHGGEQDSIGAVAGLVLHPGAINAPPDFLDGSLKDVERGMNLQWFSWNGGPREVGHLYSSFLINVQAARKSGGYPRELSVVSHREETIMSHQMFRAGFKLVVDPRAVTWHLRESTGGIRSFDDQSLWEHDEQIFQSYLKEWGEKDNSPTKLVVLDCGIGDHFAFKSILPQLKAKHTDKELCLAVCYPNVFDGEGLKLISIADARNMLGQRYDSANLYKWCWEKAWDRPLTEAMLEFWG